MSPAVLLTLLFLLFPLVFILQMSFTRGQLVPVGRRRRRSPPQNFVAMAGRYLPNVLVTIQLAALSMVVEPDLRRSLRLHPGPQGPLPRAGPGVHGLPHVRGAVHRVRHPLPAPARRTRVAAPRWRSASRTCRCSTACRPSCSRCPIFTFPFMVMNIGDGPQQRRPEARGGGRLPRRAAVADVPADPAAADPVRDRRRHADGLRLEPRHVRRAGPARDAQRAAVAGA